MKMRSIVAGATSVNRKIGMFIDNLLIPHSCNVKSYYIWDTADFMNNVMKEVEKNTVPGIEAIKYWPKESNTLQNS